jgi:RNA polymerase sigma-70 factor (ECF subfamily)
MEQIWNAKAPGETTLLKRPLAGLEAEGVLIDRTLRGGTDAFGDLVRPYMTYLNRFARNRLRSDVEADDAVQQAVLRAFSHLDRFRREASFKTWLSAIALNEVNHLRRSSAGKTVVPLHEGRIRNFADPATSADINYQRSQDVERLRVAVRQLPEKYRLMIELRDFRELSVAETARSLSITVSAAKTRHHRARRLLVRSLNNAKRVRGIGKSSALF